MKEQENLSSTEAQVQCVFGFDGFMPQRGREWIMGDPMPRPLRILAVNQLDTRELNWAAACRSAPGSGSTQSNT